MSVFLHHYPASLFSEKIRLLLGYLGLPWHSVVIPSVMPRPLLMPLSGGYRRTPVLQIDSNVYCDTAVIARGLARHCGDTTLYAPGFAAERVAEWADAQLFRITVALNFAPDAVGVMMRGRTPEEIAEFAKDRAALSEGATLQTLSPAAARTHLEAALAQLDAGLGDGFLFGRAPSIADFSLYHCLWFLANHETNARLLEPFAATGAWMQRMAAFGHGSVEEADGEAALERARASEPEKPELATWLPDGVSLGDPVAVTPLDYGRIPVEGRLAACSRDEIVLAREHPQTGSLMTHFPSAGFEMSKA